jgi:coatomer protein complex subunit epsilon
MGDELFSLKNNFYLGNYQGAISDALSAHVSSDEARYERDFYMYRAYIEQGQFRTVLDEVNASAPMMLQAVKLLAAYLSAGPAKETALLQLDEWLAAPEAATNWHVCLVAGIIYLHEKDYNKALKFTHQSTQLDVMAIVCHIYLAMYRVDMAKKQVEKMQQQDDDATLTKIASGMVTLHESTDKYQDALYEFQELGEKYNMSLTMLNSMALCNMQMNKMEEAERLLQDALSKSANDVTTLANMIVCMHHLRKPPDVVSRYMNQLKAIAPTHPFVAKYVELEASFDRCAAQLADVGS